MDEIARHEAAGEGAFLKCVANLHVYMLLASMLQALSASVKPSSGLYDLRRDENTDGCDESMPQSVAGPTYGRLREKSVPPRPTSLAWSRDSKLIACAGEGVIIRVIDAATGTQVQELKGGHTGVRVYSLVFGATSDVLYSGGGGDDYAIIEWKLAEGREATVTCSLQGHTDNVSSISTSFCGRMMASGSDDMTVVIWELTRKSKIRMLEGHTRGVTSVAWSGDGGFIASGSWDKTVHVWQVNVKVCFVVCNFVFYLV